MEIKLEQIVGLLIRCFAISLFVSMLFQAQLLIFTSLQYSQQGHLYWNIYGTVFLIFMFSFLFFLWRKPLLVADKLIPVSDKNKSVISSFTLEEVQSVCFSVIGFWTFLGGILYALREIVHISGNNGVLTTEIDYPRGVIGIIQALIGVGAMIGARGISRGVKQLRGQ